MKRYRTIQWGTGAVGIEALQTICDRPDLELVGVRVYNLAKDGVDAGELLGASTRGVAATCDVDQILAIDADCVCYAGTDSFGLEPVIDDLCRILSAGRNVVNIAGTKLACRSLLPEYAQRLSEACTSGGASLYYGGLNPGFALDILPALVASGVQRIESIELSEFIDPSTYFDPVVLGGIGLGLSPEEDAAGADARLAAMEALWTPGPLCLAEALGVRVDEVRSSRSLLLADRPFEVKSFPIGKGTISGFRVLLEFMIGGKPRITYESLVRAAERVGEPWPAEWPELHGGLGGYRVVVNGTPTVRLDMSFDTPTSPRWSPGDGIGGALVYTGARIVGFIPAVCEAAPGFYTPFELKPDTIGVVDWSQTSGGRNVR